MRSTAVSMAALGLAGLLASDPVPRGFPELPPVLGEDRAVLVRAGDTLLDIAFELRMGFETLQRLNPEVDPWIPLVGTVVRLPTRSILPRGPREGIVINVPEMRLYHFAAAERIEVFHVAVGDASDPTPLGTFAVGEKRVDPAWFVPQSIRAKKPELPAVVPPGPDNPLGSHWMTIGITSYGIHGTNNRWSIGREATHGCIRLYEDEMQHLFERVPPGTPIRIVYQPYKWGREDDRIFLEAHPDLYGRVEDPLFEALLVPRELALLGDLDLERVERTLREAQGTPVPVGRRPPAPATSSPTS